MAGPGPYRSLDDSLANSRAVAGQEVFEALGGAGGNEFCHRVLGKAPLTERIRGEPALKTLPGEVPSQNHATDTGTRRPEATNAPSAYCWSSQAMWS